MTRIADYLNRHLPDTPAQEVGIGGFTALVRIRETYKLTADMPTSYVEDGSPSNDHIILNPLMLTIEGDVADVFVEGTANATRLLRTAQAEIGNLTSVYAPLRTVSQLSRVSALANKAADAVRRLDDFIDRGEQFATLFGNQDTAGKSLQEQFLGAMESLHYGKQPFAIDMPFRRHEGMVITSFTATTDNQTDVTSFTLEAQQLRTNAIERVQVRKPAAGTQGQLEGVKAKGPQAGKTVPRSLLGNIVDAFGGG